MLPAAVWPLVSGLGAAVITQVGNWYVSRKPRLPKFDRVRGEIDYFSLELDKERKRNSYLEAEIQRLRTLNDATVTHAATVSGALHELATQVAADAPQP